MQNQKQVILWKPRRAVKLTPQGKPIEGEFVGKYATRVPEGTPGAIHVRGQNDAGKSWDFWELQVDSIAGNLRWIDKRDGGDYGTTLEVFLESNQFLHQISFKYDGFVLKDILNYICGLQKDIPTHYINLSYWVRKAEKNGIVQTDKDGKPVWRKTPSFRDITPLFDYEAWMKFQQENDLAGYHKTNAKGKKEWIDDAAIKFWDEKLVAVQRLLLKTDTCLPFCYNSFTACEAPNPSGGGNLTATEIEVCKVRYEQIKGLYKFPFSRNETSADTALSALPAQPTGYDPTNSASPDPFASRVPREEPPAVNSDQHFPASQAPQNFEDETHNDFEDLPF